MKKRSDCLKEKISGLGFCKCENLEFRITLALIWFYFILERQEGGANIYADLEFNSQVYSRGSVAGSAVPL